MYIYYLSQRRPSTLYYRIVHVTSIFYFRLCIFTIWVREGRLHSVTGLYTWLQSSILGYIYLLFSQRRPSTLSYRIVHVTSIFYSRLCIFTIWVREGCPRSVTGLYMWLQSSILGYVYLLFESEKAVHALLQDCTSDFNLLF
jgi:hypothetical protein